MILVITDRKEVSDAVHCELSQQEIYHMCVPLALGSFYCEQKEVCAVVLDCVSAHSEGEMLCHTLRRAYEPMPIAAIVSPHVRPNMPIDRLFRDTSPTSLAKEIVTFCRELGCDNTAFSTYYLSIDAAQRTFYMGHELKLSPQETRLLKCLFYRAPFPTEEQDISLLCEDCTKKNLLHVADSIRRINRRAKRLDPRPLIVYVPNKGYRLRDGIL